MRLQELDQGTIVSKTYSFMLLYIPCSCCLMADYVLVHRLHSLFIVYTTTATLHVRTISIILKCLRINFPFSIALVHPENPLYNTLSCSSVEALRVIELPRNEYLLVFATLAAYVDRHGRRSRDREIMYPALPVALSEFRLSTTYLELILHSNLSLI